VKGEESADVHWLAEDLAKYGIHGERLFSGIAGYGLREAEEKLTQEGVDRIKWQDIAVPDLCRFLDAEKLTPLKKRLREEIFYRLWGRQAENYTQLTVSDSVTRDMLTVIGLSGQGNRFKGGELFTKVIAPMSLLIGKMEFENEVNEKLSHEVIG
jgi:hypothetical protein